MNFVEMIKLIDRDYKITNSSWAVFDKLLYIQYIEGYGVVSNGDISDTYDFDFTDYYDEDWEIYKEQPKLHTFEEALKAYKSGKSIKRKDFPILELEDNFSLDKDELMANDWIIIDKEG